MYLVVISVWGSAIAKADTAVDPLSFTRDNQYLELLSLEANCDEILERPLVFRLHVIDGIWLHRYSDAEREENREYAYAIVIDGECHLSLVSTERYENAPEATHAVADMDYLVIRPDSFYPNAIGSLHEHITMLAAQDCASTPETFLEHLGMTQRELCQRLVATDYRSTARYVFFFYKPRPNAPLYGAEVQISIFQYEGRIWGLGAIRREDNTHYRLLDHVMENR